MTIFNRESHIWLTRKLGLPLEIIDEVTFQESQKSAPRTDFRCTEIRNVPLTDFLANYDFRYANLTNIPDLQQCLTNKSFSFAHIQLPGLRLAFLDLKGVNFMGANLTGANLYFCDLRYANLAGADLTDARFELCDFDGANLNQTITKRSEFNSCRTNNNNQSHSLSTLTR